MMTHIRRHRLIALTTMLLASNALMAQTHDSIVFSSPDHSRGALHYASGDVYKGSFLKDVPNGKGEMHYANGDFYRGAFLMGRPVESVGRLFHAEDIVNNVVDTSSVMTALQRPLVGVILSGGGAQCAAQIGALKRMEEAHIPIDYVVGAGIGSVVGGLYCLGYSPDAILQLMCGMDWPRFGETRNVNLSQFLNNDSLSNISIGATFDHLLANLHRLYPDSIRFMELPVAFATIATNAHTGKLEVITQGHIGKAIQASIARPSISLPSSIDGQVLFDGSLINKFPSDICFQIGADILIGVDVKPTLPPTTSVSQSWDNLMEQLITTSIYKENNDESTRCNLYIHPAIDSALLADIDSASLARFARMGYDEADKQVSQLSAIAHLMGSFGWSYNEPKHKTSTQGLLNNNIKLASIALNHPNEQNTHWVTEQQRMDNRALKLADIEKAIASFMGSGYFSDVTYELKIRNTKRAEGDSTNQEEKTYDLVMNFQSAKPYSYGFKYRADTEEGAAILFNTGYRLDKPKGFQAALNARLSSNPRVNAKMVAGNRRKLDANLSYHFRKGFYDMCDQDSVYANTSSFTHIVKLYLSRQMGKRWTLAAGVDETFLNFNQLMVSQVDMYGPAVSWLRNSCLGPFVQLHTDSRDYEAFPTKGLRLDGMVQWHLDNSDNVASLEVFNQHGFLDAHGVMEYYLTLDEGNMTISPKIFGRWLEGNSYYFAYRNVAGGDLEARYMDYQMPFIGINTPQIIGDAAVVARCDFRLNIGDKHHVTAIANYLYATEGLTTFFSFGDPTRVFSSNWGFALQYGYNASFGPITADIHWSDMTHSWGVYLNLGYYF